MTQQPSPSSEPTLYLGSHSIVLVGSFNPTIFHPVWFVKEGLVREDEGKEAKTEIVHQQISVISTKWFRLEVTPERFVGTTTQEQHFEALRDLVIGTFRILHHTPVTMLGINVDAQYQMPSEEACHAIGNKLAPKEPWAGIVIKPGMRSLLMSSQRPDDHKGYIQVRIEPSTTVKPGVFVEVNDHFDLKSDAESVENADRALSIIESTWKTSVDRSHKIIRNLVGVSA